MWKARLFFLVQLVFIACSLHAASPDSPPASSPAPQEVPSTSVPNTSESFLDTPPPQAAATDSYENAFFKMLLALAVLLILIVITFWTFRRLSKGRFRQMNQNRSIKILERRPLSAKSQLYLIEIGGKQVVIAESQLEVRPITVLEEMAEPSDQDR